MQPIDPAEASVSCTHIRMCALFPIDEAIGRRRGEVGLGCVRRDERRGGRGRHILTPAGSLVIGNEGP
jgi:hypothetical protein